MELSMERIGRFLRTVRTLFVLALVAAAGSLGGYWYGQRTSLAERWHYRLAITPDDNIPERLTELVGLGESAISPLVLSMDLPRENVAPQVRKVLQEQVTAWRKLPRQDADRRVAQLAAKLSENVEHFGPEARITAAELVVEILRWNEEGDVKDRMSLLASCDRVLQVCAPQGSAVAEKLRVQGSDSAKRKRGLDIDAHFAGISMLPQKVVLPGGGLGIESARLEGPALSDPASPTQPTTKDEFEPQRLANDHKAQPMHVNENPLRPASSADNNAADASNPEGDDRTARANRSGANRFASLLHNQNVVELCSMLHAEEPQILEGAVAELKRRGLSPRHVELGKRLTDPDPAQRRHWAELLPRMAGIDAKPWLMWLSHDQDADVRLAVVTLMATSGDPDMQSRVSQMGRDDEDPRIQTQAARFAEGAKASRR
jgi:hypothetical protein